MVGMHAGFALFSLFFLAVPVILIVVVVWALTRPRPMPPQAYGPPPGPPGPQQPPQSPLDILQRRFASGEINAEEYEKARDLLKGDPPSS